MRDFGERILREMMERAAANFMPWYDIHITQPLHGTPEDRTQSFIDPGPASYEAGPPGSASRYDMSKPRPRRGSSPDDFLAVADRLDSLVLALEAGSPAGLAWMVASESAAPQPIGEPQSVDHLLEMADEKRCMYTVKALTNLRQTPNEWLHVHAITGGVSGKKATDTKNFMRRLLGKGLVCHCAKTGRWKLSEGARVPKGEHKVK